MRAKKTRGRPASIQYLLSLDRTLRRVSLRKIVERVTPAASASKAAKPAKRNGAASRRTSLEPPALVFGAVCVIAAAALIVARQPAREGRVAQLDAPAQIDRIEAAISSAAVPEPARQPTSKKVAAPKPALAEAASATSAPAVARPAPAAKTVEAAEPAATTATNLAAAAPAASDDQPGKIVTLAGCLERNDASFLLKDTSGDAAPKSRSWKSGFLRKRSSSVELLDETPRFRLASYVGRRVETTGVLVDREMRVRSFRVHGSCD